MKYDLKKLAKKFKFMEWEIWERKCWNPQSGYKNLSGKNWIIKPISSINIEVKSCCITICNKNILQHDYWKIIFPYSFSDFFYWEMELSGDIENIQLQAENGKDRLFGTDLNIIRDKVEPYTFRVYGDLKKPEDICFEYFDKQIIDKDGYYPVNKLKTIPIFTNKITGGFYPSIVVPRHGKINIHAWNIEGQFNSDEKKWCPVCGGPLVEGTDDKYMWKCNDPCKVAWT